MSDLGANPVAIGRNGAVVRQLTTLFNVGVAGGLTDGQLLERFASRSGEAAELAFAALVERHGPLVLRVCRSVLRDEHEALDAFQATFLVLVNKAGSLWVCDSLAPWLHAVAYRVALCARSTAARRHRLDRRHAQEVAITTTEADGGATELGAVLHEEIERLPDRYRVAIVLCDLEGRSHDEAARHLGWPVGTVKSRQARGRDRLRGRLVRRGLAPSIGLGSLIASGAEAAPVSNALTDATAVVATRTTSTGAGAASAQVASLTKEILMRLMLGKLKWAAASLLALAIVAAGALGLGSRVRGGPPARGQATPAVPKSVQAPAEAPREGPGKIYFQAVNPRVSTDQTSRSGSVASPNRGSRTSIFSIIER
jgi:RNA polymerase sigma factor (sigma-70 family)